MILAADRKTHQYEIRTPLTYKRFEEKTVVAPHVFRIASADCHSFIFSFSSKWHLRSLLINPVSKKIGIFGNSSKFSPVL